MATGSITKYRALVRTVECGNMSVAASSMQYTQSAFSHMISSLERKIGFKLIIRNHSGIRLTPEGEMVYGKIKEILALQEEFKDISARIRGAEPGQVRIGGVTGVLGTLAGRLIGRLEEEEAQIQVAFTEAENESILRQLREFALDLGIVFQAPKTDFEFLPIMEESLFLIAPEGHPLAGLPAVGKEDLCRFPQLISSREEAIRLEDLFGERGRFQYREWTSSSAATLAALVRSGKGVRVVGELELKSLAKEGLRVCRFEEPVSRTIGIARPRLSFSGKTVYHVIHLLQELAAENGRE